MYVNMIRQKAGKLYLSITVTVSKGVYEYFLANSCSNLSCKLVSHLESDYLQNAANTRICKLDFFVDFVLYKICPYK